MHGRVGDGRMGRPESDGLAPLNHQNADVQSYRVLGLGTASANGGGRGDLASVTVNVGQSLTPPSTLGSSFPSTTVNRISWSSVPGADHYKVRTDTSPTGNFFSCSGNITDTQFDTSVPSADGDTAYHKVMACDNYDACSPMTTPFTLSERANTSGWNYAFTYYNSAGLINFQFINLMPFNLQLQLHVTNGNLSNSTRVTSTNGSDPTPCIAYNTVSPMIAYPASSFGSLTVGTLGHTVQDSLHCGMGDGGDGVNNRWGYLPPPGGPVSVPGSGLWDMEIGPGIFHCIARTDTDPVTLVLSATTQCYSENAAALGLAGVEPPCDALHGNISGPGTPPVQATPAPVVAGEGSCGGRTAPPPYTGLPPVILSRSYDPVTYTVSYIGCFADVGGALWPNIIVQLSALGTSTTAKVYAGQTNANCDGSPPTPSGSYSTRSVTMTAASTQRDYDGDGCTDLDELWLGKRSGSTFCGDDPWNPYDTPSGSPLNVTGSWDIVMEKTRADAANGTPAPGYYYNCKTDIAQSGTSLTAPILCYVDNPGVTANPQAANCAVNPGGTCANAAVNNCPPAPAKYCGDGLPGAAPPGCAQAGQSPPVTCATLAGQGAGCPTLPCDVSQYQFWPIGTSEAWLLGSIGGTPATISLSGCHANLGGDGNVYMQAKINAYTGLGYGNLYANAGCTASEPPISVRIFAVRQAPGAEPSAGSQDSAGRWTGCGGTDTAVGYTLCRDSDGDGCPDQVELTNAQGSGGLRDPLNRWDFFNPEKVNTPHKQTVADILKVNAQYGKNQGNALYTIDTDRTAIIGGNVWTLGPPDGQQTVADILAANKQYNHNC
jgi:hypothetical protein